MSKPLMQCGHTAQGTFRVARKGANKWMVQFRPFGCRVWLPVQYCQSKTEAWKAMLREESSL